jgi:hypothetical protein
MAYTTIDLPTEYFNTVLYAGNNGATQSVTGVGFQPDFVWIKNRTDARNHVLTDIVRGATKTLFSQDTLAEVTNPTDGYLSSFGSDGFSVSQGSIGNENVCATDNYVSWNWLASNTTTSNTAGTLTSTVSANTTSGFSIVSYTGNGSAGATVGHGLGAVPKMMIHKDRTTGSYQWGIYTSTLGPTKNLNFTSGAENTSSTYYNDTAPTSSVFSLGTNVGYNANTDSYIAYCFAEIKGYSKFGSYTGNGNNDGTFVYLGFKPAFVMVKNTVQNSRNWTIIDNKRNIFNPETQWLYPNAADAEFNASSYPVDFVSNGFKIRTGAASYFNTSAENYIYMAFAENPFVTSTSIPTTAR